MSMARRRRTLVVDNRYRITLGKTLAQIDSEYEASVDDQGVITLYPIITVNPFTLDPESRAVFERTLDA